MKTHLLVIDPQNDFMDYDGSALPVLGANADMDRLAALVNRAGSKIDGVFVTLDSHHLHHIANPALWADKNGASPNPFTMITVKDVVDGVWRARIPSMQDWFNSYVRALEAGGRYALVIWPPHCLIGSTGHAVQANLFRSMLRWEEQHSATAQYVQKGSCMLTEHYSAIKADVEVDSEPSTFANHDLVDRLNDADMILVAGQALSHCVANTVRDLADFIGASNVSKIHLLRDCTSNVNGFNKLGEDFINEMTARGMNVANSTALWP